MNEIGQHNLFRGKAKVKKGFVLALMASFLFSCTGKEEYPFLPEQETSSFLNTEGYSLPGGKFLSGHELPLTTLGEDEDAYLDEENQVIYIKQNGRWYQTSYEVKDNFISSNGHQFYRLSNGLTYDAGLKEEISIDPDSDYDGIPDNIDSDNHDTTFKGTFLDSLETYPFSFSVDMDYRRFFSQDNREYHYDMASLGIVLAASVYPHVQFTVNGKTSYARNDIMPYLGGEDSLDILLTHDDFTIDVKDTLSCVLSHHRFLDQGNIKEVVFVSFEGTRNGDQWYSDFDFGVDDSVYEERTGQHPDWKDKENHKGFDVTLNRFLPLLEEYTRENLADGSSKAIFITGHSRGAALANLFGERMASDENYRSFTYTFASPNTTRKRKECPSVFNIINQQDLITYLPMKETVGFEHNGKDMTFTYEDDYREEFTSLFPELDYVPTNGPALASALASIAEDAKDYYVIKEDENHRLYPAAYGETFSTREEAEKDLEMKLSDVSLCGPETMFETKIIQNEDSSYREEIYSCPAALTSYFAGCLGKESDLSMILYLINMFAIMPSAWLTPLEDVGTWVSGFILNHVISTYFAIVETTK